MRRNETSGTIYANFWFKGKCIRQSLKTSDKTVARNRLTKLRLSLETQQRKGNSQPAKSTLVSEIAPRFLASLSGMSKSDQVRSKGHMKFFVEEFGRKNPRDLLPMEIKEWLQELREERGFAEDSWNKYVATFYKFYEFLIQNSFASENPMEKFDFLKGKANRKYTPTTGQVQAILAHIKQKAYFPGRHACQTSGLLSLEKARPGRPKSPSAMRFTASAFVGAAGLVDGHGARACVGIRHVVGVDHARLKAEFAGGGAVRRRVGEIGQGRV